MSTSPRKITETDRPEAPTCVPDSTSTSLPSSCLNEGSSSTPPSAGEAGTPNEVATPRTDAFYGCPGSLPGKHWQTRGTRSELDFARTLEREIAALKSRLALANGVAGAAEQYMHYVSLPTRVCLTEALTRYRATQGDPS